MHVYILRLSRSLKNVMRVRGSVLGGRRIPEGMGRGNRGRWGMTTVKIPYIHE